MGEAREAEIRGKHAGARKRARDRNRVLPAAAARHQNVDPVSNAERSKRRGWKRLPQPVFERCWLPRRLQLDPARIGVLLVLLADAPRHLVIDLGQLRQARRELPLLEWLVHLLPYDAGNRLGPRPVEHLGRDDRVQRTVAGNEHEWQQRNRFVRAQR